ncbi:MAG: MMPL family transporter [Acidimicrobiia bacterium]|nr:MMPL family transporter [Acidimicrobiia bacterium]
MLPLSTRRSIFTRLRDRAGLVLVAALVVTGLLAIPFVTMSPDETASQEPSGVVFEARDRVEERFVATVLPVPIIIEAVEGSVTDRAVLLDLLAGSERLRTDAELSSTMIETFDPETGIEIRGLVTIADLIDASLPGGVEDASQADIDGVVGELISTLGLESQALGLSVASSFDDQANRWVIPAITTVALADNSMLGFPTGGVTLGTDTEPEEYKRDIVEALSGDATTFAAWGVAIDVNLTSAEQGEAAGPFIGFTILAVLIIVGLSFRSYWVMAVSGAALAALIIWLYGISNLIGLKNDLILSLIVPIAMISFGIDFTFHSVGRYREERAAGKEPSRAFIIGMASVVGALTLALTSDAVAFLSNTVSGIESIIQFGVGTAIALAAAYVLLGIVTPLAVSVIDDRLGARPRGRAHTAVRLGASTLTGIFAMTVTLLLVFIAPVAGVIAFFAYVVMAVALPARLARPYPNAPSEARESTRVADALSALVVAVTKRWRMVVAGAAATTVVATGLALQVPTEFDVRDFFSSDTAFVTSLDKIDEHQGARAGEPALVSIEADITDPAVVAEIADFSERLRTSGAATLANDSDGVILAGGVSALLDDVAASDVAAGLITLETGVTLTDTDGNGVPDTTEQLRAIYDVTRVVGVPLDATRALRTPDTVATDVWISDDGAQSATVIEIGILNSEVQESIVAARAALDPLTADLQEALRTVDEDALVVVTSGPIVRQESLEGVSRALALSLPVSVILCLLIASAFMRSIRLGLVSIVPILMTVALLYAFMYVAGFSINIVTATIGAVSIGIGIDFAIHYTMRYREELAETGIRFDAVRRASKGTGVALLASAASSVIGFGILSFAPMPLFASYGLLTAVMIAMAAVTTLLVLPSLLVMVTNDAPADEPAPERELVSV